MNDIRKQSDKDLEKLLNEQRVVVRQFRFDISGSRAKNIKAGANAKKAVARILTEQNARKAQ